MTFESPFHSDYMGGFECSTHRRHDGRRLDLTAATRHDVYAESDYTELRRCGIRTVREGLRWHLIECSASDYNWSTFVPMVRAARRAGVQVVWDLCHYGCPDHIDIWSAAFVDRFGRFAASAAQILRDEGEVQPIFCPINEISFWAWAGAEVGYMGPATKGRGAKLKRQLARASIAAIEAVRRVSPTARFIFAEPAIHVEPRSPSARSRAAADAYRKSQFEAFDLIGGLREPELGGRHENLDMIGLNFYPHNQWFYRGSTIPLGHHSYRSFGEMIAEVYERYGRPILISETGAEGSARAAWLHYVSDEVRAAQVAGVPVLGICLYPILDYPGWDNNRICKVGLFSMPDANGKRLIDGPLAEELGRQQAINRQTIVSSGSLSKVRAAIGQ
jgi:beta-glucosidase/6-phospho-beta-glucosidase/beta-galactosidase